MKSFAQPSFPCHVVAKIIKIKHLNGNMKIPYIFFLHIFLTTDERLGAAGMDDFSMATCALIILAEYFVCLLIKGRNVPVRVLKCSPWEGHAAGWATSVWQGTKQPGAELQMRIACSAVMEKLESSLWSWHIKRFFVFFQMHLMTC